MLLTALLVVALSSRGVWTRKSEPVLDDGHGAGLFRGSDRYDFAVEVPAAGTECFWHFAHQSGSFYLTFMVQWVTGMANDHRLFVTVSSPRSALIASTNEAVGHMIFQTEETGFYQMCLRNHNNQFGAVRAYLNFGVIYDGSKEAEVMGEEEKMKEKILDGTLIGIEDSVQKIGNQIIHAWRHYNFARMRKGKDYYLVLSNLDYVTWWSATQSLVILLTGYLQLRVLKGLFNTEPGRPRC